MDYTISPEIKEEAKKSIQSDPFAEKIDKITEEISEKLSEISKLKADLEFVKSERPPITLKLRESVKRCVEVDAHNPAYFLKSAAGVYKCVAFINKIDVTKDLKIKCTITLSSLFKEEKVGRIHHKGNYYYGLPEFFNETLTELKDEYKQQLNKLII